MCTNIMSMALINVYKQWQNLTMGFCCDVHEYIHFVNTFDSLKYLYFYLTSLSVFRWSHSESNCFVVCLMKYESGQWLRLDLIWPRTIWSTRHTHNSSPSFPSFSLWHKNLPYPILCNHCPIMQWEMPPATTIYLCVWKTLLNCDHTTNTFSFSASSSSQMRHRGPLGLLIPHNIWAIRAKQIFWGSLERDRLFVGVQEPSRASL